MSQPINKQLTQVNNILNTLIEATEHFHKLVKDKEFNQSIFIFSSIVDGFSAVSRIHSANSSEEWISNKNKLEGLLFDIAKHLESGNFIKISEIIQFTFLPGLNKLNTLISDELITEEKETYIIGIFSTFANPRRFYPEPRVNALVNESEKQNVRLIFFTSSDVNFEKEEIAAEAFIDGQWKRIISPFPDVINNVGVGKKSHTERKLRRMIPFTSFHVGNKVSLPQRIVKHRKFAELLVPFRLCSNIELIHQFMEDNNKVVFKYLLSNRGENIFFVTKKGSRYILLEHKKERILNQDGFNNWLETVVLKEKDSFIVQKYIHTRTKDNEPYHIRAHVQKNGEGNWVLTHIYPRLGNKKSNLSNVATEGRVEDFHTFLINEYGEEKGRKYDEDILRLSIEVAQHLDKLYNLALDELGIDFAIDENGRYWMHEANNGPQTAYHEEKRAVNTIAYAKYLASNGIYHTDSYKKAQIGFFQSRNSKLERVNLSSKITIGILTPKIQDNNLLNDLNIVADKANVHLVAFKPKDIDTDEMEIKGYLFENNNWVTKIVGYPDVIIDHVKLRDEEDSNWLYEELEDIPFTNTWAPRNHSRSEILNNIAQALGDNIEILAPFSKVKRTRDIFKYLEDHTKVILKPEFGLLNSQYIEVAPNKKYLVTKTNVTKEYNELQLLNMLRELVQENQFIVQKDTRFVSNNGESHTINCHLLLDKDSNWVISDIFSNHHNQNIDNVQGNLECILEEHYGDDYKEIMKAVGKEASTIVKILQSLYSNITEVNVKFGLSQQELSVIEVNPNGPDIVGDTTKYAENIIKQAIDLVDLDPKN